MSVIYSIQYRNRVVNWLTALEVEGREERTLEAAQKEFNLDVELETIQRWVYELAPIKERKVKIKKFLKDKALTRMYVLSDQKEQLKDKAFSKIRNQFISGELGVVEMAKVLPLLKWSDGTEDYLAVQAQEDKDKIISENKKNTKKTQERADQKLELERYMAGIGGDADKKKQLAENRKKFMDASSINETKGSLS